MQVGKELVVLCHPESDLLMLVSTQICNPDAGLASASRATLKIVQLCASIRWHPAIPISERREASARAPAEATILEYAMRPQQADDRPQAGSVFR